MEDKIYYCDGACGAQVKEYGDRCPACEERFNETCDRWRAMRRSIRGKSEKEQLDAINKFRCGE